MNKLQQLKPNSLTLPVIKSGSQDELDKATQAYQTAKVIAEESQQIGQENLQVLEEAKKLLIEAGYSAVTWEGKRRTKKVAATWVVGLASQTPVYAYPPVFEIESLFASWKQRWIEKSFEVKTDRILKEHTQRQSEERNKKMRLAVKYAIELGMSSPENQTPMDVIECVLEKDKYLRLSDAMHRVRDDWSDGCGPVIHALSCFVFEAPIDNEMYISVSDAVDTFNVDPDGRIFRDCTWNYGRIAEYADTRLLQIFDELHDQG